MARHLAKLALAASIYSTLVAAQQAKCGPGLKCPSATPCCSLYGQCGVGAYCLGGCDPLFSTNLDSCVPAPVCQSQKYSFKNLDDVVSIDKYLGDNSKAKWVSSGKPLQYPDGGVLLTMAQDTVGTLLASTEYVWYGKISATMTSSQGKGVVTAFIMMSDVKDEIDFEFVGTDTEHVQSNYYSQGVTNYNHGKNHSASDTAMTQHTYTLDWKPDTLTWYVDDKVVRTLEKSSTWNSTANRFDYPQTPSRVMLSLWPAGLPSNGQGTIDWAGGLIDWNSQYMKNGYYYSMVKDVSVECYKPPPMAQIKSSDQKSYVYTDARGTNDTVAIVDKHVNLASFYATGDNPGTDPNGSKGASASKSASGPLPTNVETVPGMSGGGNRETEQPADGSTGGGQTNGGSGGSPAPNSGSGSSPSNGGSGFTQGGQTGAAAQEKKVGGSVFAVCVALVALLFV
jgi:beta-glucanase (GH16 family)